MIGLDLFNPNWNCPIALPNGMFLPGCSIFSECYTRVNSQFWNGNGGMNVGSTWAIALAVNINSAPVCTASCNVSPLNQANAVDNGIATIGSTDLAVCSTYYLYSIDIFQQISGSFPLKNTHLICLDPRDGDIFHFSPSGQGQVNVYPGAAVINAGNSDNYFFVDPTSSFCIYAKAACP